MIRASKGSSANLEDAAQLGVDSKTAPPIGCVSASFEERPAGFALTGLGRKSERLKKGVDAPTVSPIISLLLPQKKAPIRCAGPASPERPQRSFDSLIACSELLSHVAVFDFGRTAAFERRHRRKSVTK